ncbi:uncharacterized protein B0I36DRAFT_92318 [Microdochium trichocladiopsis]|uniref:Uncharacterized protein n=1 Tax=Microdochium trichocladiopsis TaxID=1682393 RepID=A0A9P8YED2_9PEZI|nr:uncharacterized protein B0I36DRAFT_92318 [Microdochium trichocladiopsis]KAH7035412.1 hypothetical protein B0I36DRAFT_92318 [Microdochium trichocladiopsis]
MTTATIYRPSWRAKLNSSLLQRSSATRTHMPRCRGCVIDGGTRDAAPTRSIRRPTLHESTSILSTRTNRHLALSRSRLMHASSRRSRSSARRCVISQVESFKAILLLRGTDWHKCVAVCDRRAMSQPNRSSEQRRCTSRSDHQPTRPAHDLSAAPLFSAVAFDLGTGSQRPLWSHASEHGRYALVQA